MRSEDENTKADLNLDKAIATYNEKRSPVFEQRQKDRKHANTIGGIGILAVVSLGGLALALMSAEAGIWVAGLGLIGVFGLWGMLYRQADQSGKDLQASMAGRLLPQIVDVQDFYHKPIGNEFPKSFPATIVPYYDKVETSDLVKGNHLGCRFEMLEAELIDERRKGPDVTTFQGLAILLKLKNLVIAPLTVRTRRWDITRAVLSVFGGTPAEPLIQLDDAQFTELYDVHCGDETYARKIFTEDGRDFFRVMQETYATGKFQFMASGRDVRIMLEHDRNFFALPDLGVPMDPKRDIARLKDEFDGLLKLIDDVRLLLGDRPASADDADNPIPPPSAP